MTTVVKRGILLDIGCRDRKESNFTGISGKHFEGVDIIHDLEVFPYPIESDSCLTIKAAHVLEHIKPWLVFDWFDEMWRLLMPNGKLAVSSPYANTQGFVNDPSHCTYVNEATFQHLDPNYPMYQQHKPKPWHLEFSAWRTSGNIEAVLTKRSIADVYTIDLAQKAVLMGAIQKRSELAMLVDMLRNMDFKTVVEIGTARGGVFYVLCQLANPKATLVSIDMPGGQFGGGYSKTDEERFKAFGKPAQKLHFIKNDSHEQETLTKLKRILKGSLIDVLFIDGDHTYEGVKKDWEMYSPLVRGEGLVVFHDICHHTHVPECQVDRLWEEIRINEQTWEFIDPVDISWGGIGVVRKKITEIPLRTYRVEKGRK